MFQGVSRFTHACIYDRPGTIRYTRPPALTTRSTPVSMPRTVQSEAFDLDRLLIRAGLCAPVVIVAHSMAGLIDRYFASTYRGRYAEWFWSIVCACDQAGDGPLLSRYDRLLNRPGTPLEQQPGWETLAVDGAIRAVQQARPLPETRRWRRMRVHLDRGSGDASPGSVRQIALALGGGQVEAHLDPG